LQERATDNVSRGTHILPSVQEGNKMKQFELSMTKRYYVFHPIKFIKEVCRNLKYAWQRIFRGWDDMESWNIYSYFLDRNIEMLNVFSKNLISYPPDSSPEEWADTLLKITDGFEAGKKLSDLDTVAWDEKYKLMCERGISGLDSINDGKVYEIDKEINFWERHEKEMKEFEERFNEGMKLFVDNFWHLWD
jgi:hypothetical protein